MKIFTVCWVYENWWCCWYSNKLEFPKFHNCILVYGTKLLYDYQWSAREIKVTNKTCSPAEAASGLIYKLTLCILCNKCVNCSINYYFTIQNILYSGFCASFVSKSWLTPFSNEACFKHFHFREIYAFETFLEYVAILKSFTKCFPHFITKQIDINC